MNDVTQLLKKIEEGDSSATDELLPLVYQELRSLARSKVAQEKNQTLEATALVHDAYLRLVGSRNSNWENRAHFFGAAAEAMRRILIEQARARKRLKRGGDRDVFSLDSVGPIDDQRAAELIQLDEALDELAKKYPDKAELVKLKYFVGVTTNDAAEILKISPRTAERHWAFARAWLYREMLEEF
jgi:RNA polymerase sigma factor (TIGR02999 family)